MPNVFDNIETPFLENETGEGLKDALKLAKRGDFCVGYFNLRGWRCIDDVVAKWHLPEDAETLPPCRLLVGMQRLPHEQLRAWLSHETVREPDNKQLAKLRKEAAQEFRKQLTIGNPTTPTKRVCAASPRSTSVPPVQQPQPKPKQISDQHS